MRDTAMAMMANALMSFIQLTFQRVFWLFLPGPTIQSLHSRLPGMSGLKDWWLGRLIHFIRRLSTGIYSPAIRPYLCPFGANPILPIS